MSRLNIASVEAARPAAHTLLAAVKSVSVEMQWTATNRDLSRGVK